MIDTYLKATIGTSDYLHPLTATQTAAKLQAADPPEHYNQSVHRHILSKMETEYGAKFRKNIVRTLQQKKTDNKHLLTINAQVMASSFQYLSYNELCRIMPTCSYFLYLHHSYPGLAHHFINLDHGFWLNAMRNMVNWKTLTHFKHIRLESVYQGQCPWQWNATKRTKLFIEILKRIKNDSTHTLEIAVEQSSCADNQGKQAALEYIADKMDWSSITTLIWIKDQMPEPRKSLKQITANFPLHFPNLEHVDIRAKLQGYFWLDPDEVPSPSIQFECVQSVLSTNNLVSLNLQCPHLNLLDGGWKAIESIATIKTLRKLSISSLIDAASDIVSGINPFVEDLSARFMVRASSSTSSGDRAKVSPIMTSLLSVFVGVRKLEFGGVGTADPRIDGMDKVVAADWMRIFGALFRSKTAYSVGNGSVAALESVELSQISRAQGIYVMKALRHNSDQKHYHLQRFSMGIVIVDGKVGYHEFITDHFIPFMKHSQNEDILESVRLEYGTPLQYYELQLDYWIYYPGKDIVCVSEAAFESELEILDNLPKGLQFLELKPPQKRYSDPGLSHGDPTRKELLKALVKLQSGNGHEIKEIVLSRFQLSCEEKKYLTFMFGFNGRLCMDDGEGPKYVLLFNE